MKQMTSLSKEFSGIECYIKEDILSNAAKFENVEYVFSTWYMPEFHADELRKALPSLKAIFYAAGTVKYFAEPFLKAGVRVFSSSKANGVAVAEFTAAQIILANKGFFQAQKANKSFLWGWAFRKAKSYSEKRPGNYNSKIGLIGCGAVGSEVVRLLKPYNLSIFVYDPYLSEEHCDSLGVKKVSIEKLFEICDVVSNHLPDIPDTKGLINYGLLNRMKDNSTFINTGRGAQVIEKDLAKLLKKRPSICALLDVVQHDILRPWSPLLRRKNVFISPHIAGSTGNEVERMVEYAIRAYNDFCNNKANNCEVTLSMLDTMA